MGSAYLNLLESNEDLLGPSSDLDTVKSFLNGLTSSVDIPNLSPKELKPLLSRANTSLHSSNKHRGLLILQTLVDRCNSEVFESNASNWLSTSVSRVLDSKDASLREKEIACNIIRSVLQIAVEIPNVAKQMPALTGQLVSSLLKNFDSSESFLITLTCVLKTFPGSSGSSEKIKKKIFGGLGSRHHISSKRLCQCASYLPRLGGSGKEGAKHKEEWTLYFKRFLKTYQITQEHLLNLSSDNTKDNSDFLTDIEPIQELSTELKSGSSSTDLLAHSLRILKQLSIVKDLLSEFLKSPFPYAKIFQPSLIYELSEAVFNSAHLLYDTDNISEEFNVWKCVYPGVVSINLNLLQSLVRVCRKDLAPFSCRLLKYINEALDLSFGKGESFELKMAAYKLLKISLRVLGAGTGVHLVAEEIIPKLLREIVPSKHKSSTTKEETPVTSKNTSKKSKDKQIKWKKTVESKNNVGAQKTSAKKAKLSSESLSLLSQIFTVSGSLIAPSLHKDVQILTLRLSIDVLHQQSLYGSIYSFPDVRLAVYQLLISLTLNPHFKFHSPLRYVIAILSKGLSDEHPKVLEVVRSGLLGIESVFHGRSPYLGSESYLTDTEVEKVMNEVVKVHETKIYTKRGIPEFPSQVRSNQLEDVVQNVISSTSDPNVDEEMMDQSYEVEVSQPSLSKLQETNPDILKKVSEMEEILKASKAKNSDEDLIQTFYNQEKSPIVIPEDTLEKFYERDRQKASSHPPESKKPKLLTEENKLQEVDSEDGLDLNEMLSSFVHKPDLESLKRKFKDDYVGS